MNDQELINYTRIKEAIEYLDSNYKQQPDLDEVARKINLSPYHFQRMFTKWSGVSPKQFLQYISIEHAKQILKESRATLFDAAHEIGLSGTGRLHDLFISIENMTPGEYKNGGKNLIIKYSYAETPFGEIIIASTHKGICYLSFVENKKSALELLVSNYPTATFNNATDPNQQSALSFFDHSEEHPEHILLHLKGTDFQLKVWEALLKIPLGKLTTYGDIAQQISNPKACRAVGSAIGSNPIAYIIPCHRVIQSTGTFGQYMWGSTRKTAIIGWESGKISLPG